MSTSTAPSVRCPSCSAHVRAGSDWCTLCYADLRPAPPARASEPPAAPPAEMPSAAPRSAEPDPTVEPADVPAEMATPASRPRGKHARRPSDEPPAFGTPADRVPEVEVEALAEQMLAELAGEGSHPLGSLAGVVDSRPKQLALMVGGALAAMLVLFVLMALLGSFV